MTDQIQIAIRYQFEKGFGSLHFAKIEARDMRDALLHVSRRTTFDSARDWLDGLEWDRVRRVESFVPRYFGADDTPYTRAVGMYLWTALAGRTLCPGVKADMVPVLVSPQGWRKSAGVAALVPSPELFRELSLDQRDDNLARQLRGKVVCELAELSGLGKADLEWLKTWITRQHEEFVLKYREHTHRYARRGVFVGTSNRDDFLIDETGNRRWLPFRIGRMVDVDAIVRDRDQLWAEGAALYGKHGVMFREAEQLAVAEHEEFAYHDSWEESIGQWLDRIPLGIDGKPTGPAPGTREVTTGDVLVQALGIDRGRIQRAQEMRVAGILRRLGYTNRKVSTKAGRINAWVRSG